MSATVHLCRIAPDGYAHHRAFDEVADTAAWAIRTLGHTVDIVWNTTAQDPAGQEAIPTVPPPV